MLMATATDLLEEGCGDALHVVLRVDNQEVHGADEAAGSDGRSKREDRASNHDALRLRDEDARLRQVHELAEQIGCREGARVGRTTQGAVAECDEPVDVRDTGRSDQIFHACGFTSTGRATEPKDGALAHRPGPRLPAPASVGSTTVPGRGRTVLHSVRRRI